LALSVDFSRKVLSGTAMWEIDNSGAGDELWLDTRDLTISKVSRSGPRGTTLADFELGERHPLLGRALRISITPETSRVSIEYETSPEAAALQWLAPSQTAGGKHPFLFTQSQAILARTWIPCQDTPGVRFTYSATVEVDAGLSALMSASQDDYAAPSADRVRFGFRMPQRIPSYLLALAVGELQFREISHRCGVWAEPSVVDSGAWEFAETESMMKACEKLFGPYRWERYDILVLPPSFPFGGMENPRLTFATPTILAGDRSLVALIAHELAHSWSGNLVTNADWNDFWLNEGFTVYLEHRIMEALHGKPYDEMLAKLGLDELEDTIADLTSGANARPADTHLKLDLAGRDPDDGMTDVAYEKGYLFLRMCEETIGRERWDSFLRGYFDAHAFQSMTTEGFVAYLREQLIASDAALEARLRVDDWIYGPGIPDNAPKVHSDAFAKVEAQVKRFVDGADSSSLATAGWSSHEWRHFVRSLPRPLAIDRLAQLDAAFGLTKTGNSEVKCQWFLVTIPSRYAPADEALESFLLRVGRRKFLKPLYEALAATPEGKETARVIYARARAGYHRISSDTIDQILDWKP
jgi:aminopeptidase N